MKVEKTKLILMTIVFTTAFFIFVSSCAFASTPEVVSVTLNSLSKSVAFNPNNSEKVSINIITDIPVKFNTVAICLASDSTCSRSTAVKFFTQATSYLTSITKEWDGKTGGSNPIVVGEGAYNIKITIKDETGQENIVTSDYLVNVDYSSQNTDTESENNTVDSDDNSTTTATTSEITNQSVKVVTKTVYVSTHSEPEELSDYSSGKYLQISAGRERLSVVGNPVIFHVDYKLNKEVPNSSCIFKWSFGDGLSGFGEKITHSYKYSGKYIVVLNGDCGLYSSVSRTVVSVYSPNVSMAITLDGDIELKNNDTREINLGDWKIDTEENDYYLPKDTIIEAGKSIILSKEDTKIVINMLSRDASLLNPSRSIVYKIGNKESGDVGKSTETASKVSSSSDSSFVTIKDAEVLLTEYYKKERLGGSGVNLSSLSSDTMKATTSTETGLKTVPNSNIGLASVSSSLKTADKDGFWSNLVKLPIHGIEAILSVFYDF